MKTKMKTRHALCGLITALLLIFSTASPARAALIVTVTGVPDAGASTWNFSGSYIVTTGDTVAAGGLSLLAPTLWDSVGDLFRSYPAPGSVPDGLHAFNLGGTAQLTGSLSGALGIDQIFVAHRGGNLDGWGFASDAGHTYQAGETLTFSGTAVLPVDVLAFGGDYWLLPNGVTDTQNGATMSITVNATPVPEPGTALFGIACVGIAAFRRRRSSAV
jgi:hypothetical protein